MPSKTRTKRKVRAQVAPIPSTFEEALTRGWRIHEQLSSWRFKSANKREGFLMLTHAKTSRTLMVQYTALYELSVPYFLEHDPHD